MDIKTVLYIGDTEIGDVNRFAKNRRLSESLKSEQEYATADQFTFDISWQKFIEMVAIRFDDNPETLLRVGKTRVVYIIDDNIRFSGWLASRPARAGSGAEQILTLTFFEYFARLAGDLVVDPNDPMSPYRRFDNVPAEQYVQDLIDEFIDRAAAAGETLNWTYGTVDEMANKTIEYKDFQTVSHALCNAMNNVVGHGKFDVVIRTNPEDHSEQIIDILKPRGQRKNIIVKFPSDGVYKLWSTDYEVAETNNYASTVLVAGNGQVGNPDAGEDTAELAGAENLDFVAEYCYWREYNPQSNLFSADAVQDYADKLIDQRNFGRQAPNITMVGRPIAWGEWQNDDNGLAIGDEFFLQDNSGGGVNQSGWMRIVGMETSYDDNGVATVVPTLIRED